MLNDDSCCICLENINYNDLVRLRCDHKYHRKCIHTWVYEYQKSYCPYCKSEFHTLKYKCNESLLGLENRNYVCKNTINKYMRVLDPNDDEPITIDDIYIENPYEQLINAQPSDYILNYHGMVEAKYNIPIYKLTGTTYNGDKKSIEIDYYLRLLILDDKYDENNIKFVLDDFMEIAYYKIDIDDCLENFSSCSKLTQKKLDSLLFLADNILYAISSVFKVEFYSDTFNFIADRIYDTFMTLEVEDKVEKYNSIMVAVLYTLFNLSDNKRIYFKKKLIEPIEFSKIDEYGYNYVDISYAFLNCPTNDKDINTKDTLSLIHSYVLYQPIGIECNNKIY